MSESTLQVLTEANELLAAHTALILRVRSAQQIHRLELKELDSPPLEVLKLPLIPSSPATPEEEVEAEAGSPSSPPPQNALRQDLTPAKRARAARYVNYVPEEETIRNDYSQRYVDGGEWPQNWVLGAELEHRFEEYPKQKRLLDLKKAAVNQYALQPMYLPYPDFTSLHPSKFDVILLDPPFNSTFTWDHLQELPVPSLASDPSFVFLWVGSGAGEGLERGREILAKWGYRRCEDIVWIKTNKTTNQGPGTDPPTTSIFTRTKQHCLMGIRGTVRRSTDNWFVHCNVDTDVIIWEGDAADPTRKPPEMYNLIENFCLGMRRLEIFGKQTSLRRGWVTVFGPGQEDRLPYAPDGTGKIPIGTCDGDQIGTPMVAGRWTQESWEDGIKELSGSGKAVVPMTLEIETLRPKSPLRPGQATASGATHTPLGTTNGGGGILGMPVGMGMGMNMTTSVPRFSTGNRVMGNAVNTTMMIPQNQLMVQPVMGVNTDPMGMVMADMEELMGNWNPMMGSIGGNIGLSVGIPGGGTGVMQSGVMGNNRGVPNALAVTGMGINLGNQGIPVQMLNQLGPMGMGNINTFHGIPSGGGFVGGMGPLFNNEMNSSWMEQGQFGSMENGGWSDGQTMGGMNMVSGFNSGMNMGNMNLGGHNHTWGSGSF